SRSKMRPIVVFVSLSQSACVLLNRLFFTHHGRALPSKADNRSHTVGVRRTLKNLRQLFRSRKIRQQFVEMQLTIQIPIHKQRKVERWTTIPIHTPANHLLLAEKPARKKRKRIVRF